MTRHVWLWTPLGAVMTAALLGGCQPAAPVTPMFGLFRTFEEDVAFLEKYGPIEVIESPGGGRVAISPKYQGRVMTSAVAPGGQSLGWINHNFIAEGKTGTPFDNYGGEDRFWLGPEAGKFALFFSPGGPTDPDGNPFTLAGWQTPNELQKGHWVSETLSDGTVQLSRYVTVTNYAGNKFVLRVDRRVRALSLGEVNQRLGLSVPTTLPFVAFESVNRITNMGQNNITPETGIPAVWVLGQFPAFPGTQVILPFKKIGTDAPVNDNYFGPVPPERLAVSTDEGLALFRADGLQRGKVGLSAQRAKSVLGSFVQNDQFTLLTVVAYSLPPGRPPYVNNAWSRDAAPYAGDVINSYNDGGLGGQPTFYELETLAPAVPLGPGQSVEHTHATMHFLGESRDLATVSEGVFGVPLSKLQR